MAMDACQTRKYSSFDCSSTVCPAFLDKLHMCLCTGTFSDTCSLMIRHHDTDVLPMTACTSAASCPGLRSPEKAKSDSGSRQRGGRAAAGLLLRPQPPELWPSCSSLTSAALGPHTLKKCWCYGESRRFGAVFLLWSPSVSIIVFLFYSRILIK